MRQEKNRLGIAKSPDGREALLLIDGLGSEQLSRYSTFAPTMSGLSNIENVRAGFPSTTATSLASVGTGLTSSQHGMFGYAVRVPGSGVPGRVLNALDWDERVDPRVWQSQPTAFERAAAAGVSVSAVSSAKYEDSGLTQAALRGAEYRGVDKDRSFITQAVQALQSPRSLAYLYLNHLDVVGHGKGVGSPEWLRTLSDMDEVVADLLTKLPSGTRLWITGDHGMINAGRKIDMPTLPSEGIELIAGEPRARHVYCRAGAEGDVASAWREALGDAAEVRLRAEAVSAGWFGGPVAERLLPRIGEVLVVPKADLVLLDPEKPKESEMIGHHGGRSSAEVGVPLRFGVSEKG
jgi:hypothetical protein